MQKPKNFFNDKGNSLRIRKAKGSDTTSIFALMVKSYGTSLPISYEELEEVVSKGLVYIGVKNSKVVVSFCTMKDDSIPRYMVDKDIINELKRKVNQFIRNERVAVCKRWLYQLWLLIQIIATFVFLHTYVSLIFGLKIAPRTSPRILLFGMKRKLETVKEVIGSLANGFFSQAP